MKKKKLGEVLRDRGKITPEDLILAIAEQQGKMLHLGELMLERGFVEKEDLAAALEEVSHIPYLDCSAVVPAPEAIKLVQRAAAERYCVLPIRLERGRLILAMAAPQDLAAIGDLRFTTGVEISPRQAFRAEIKKAIAKYYDGQTETAYGANSDDQQNPAVEEIEFVSTSSRQSNQEAIQEMQADLRQRKTPAVRVVSEIIKIAMAKHASDIHIEPRAAETAVRIRVDGVLRDLQSIPRALQTSLISRIKILSDMDISERRSPQDGRFMITLGTRQIDLRVSSLPTQYGEKVVIRLLETSAPLSSFADLGLPEDISATLTELLSLPQGMILVTGPTGSGKSTTLYSSLHKLRRPSVNIVTVEDPVEYVLPGINQAHVNTKAGMTFPGVLRSILRQDPNVIMVGEIRDQETAEIAMKAAQTGHLVLSTLHTNDSVSAIIRLLDLGVQGYIISSSLTGILAQRLVRRLCSCHVVQAATPEFQARLAQVGIPNPPATMAVAAGCEKCDHTGYRGRVGIYELLRFDDSIRGVIRSSGNTDKIRETSRSNGMRSMQDDAMEKLRAGTTTLEEILRVLSFENVSSSECLNCGFEILPAFRFCPYCGARCLQDSQPKSFGRDKLVDEKILQS
ncbi:MAG: type secretion system protein [Candidatus Acidoferrum typicum]|nr:type secretion system protein [Candidatus Acidoferrum typicum]